jgi:hypothetical protein
MYDGMGVVIHGMHNDFVDVVFEVIFFNVVIGIPFPGYNVFIAHTS